MKNAQQLSISFGVVCTNSGVVITLHGKILDSTLPAEFKGFGDLLGTDTNVR